MERTAVGCLIMGAGRLKDVEQPMIAFVQNVLVNPDYKKHQSLERNVPFTAIIQTQVPNDMQGRVLSLMSTVMGLAGPIGLVIAGPLGEAMGVRGVFIVGGALSALVCAVALGVRGCVRLRIKSLDLNGYVLKDAC